MEALHLIAAAAGPMSGQLIAVTVLGCLCAAAGIADILMAALKRKKRPERELAAVEAAATTSVRNNYYIVDGGRTAAEIEDCESESEDEADTFEIGGSDFLSELNLGVRYRKSFLARLIQSTDETKSFYSEIKNALLSYKKVKSRVSWNYDAFNQGRKQLAKLTVRGKTLCLYLALDPDDYVDTKYKVERAEGVRFEDVPCMYRIKNERRKDYALELIGILAELNAIAEGKPHKEEYSLPYENTPKLIERGLIKVLSDDKAEDEKQLAEASEEKTPTDGFKPQESDFKVLNDILENELEKLKQIQRVEITVNEANDLLSDETAAALVEKTGDKGRGRMDVVNVDTLSDHFLPGEIVTLEKLKEKKLIPSLAKRVKICARGHLDKPLTVYADEFSVEAVKMILLTGGKAIRG